MGPWPSPLPPRLLDTLYLGQALGVAIGVSHGPPILHGYLVGADELCYLLLPVACGSNSEGSAGTQEGCQRQMEPSPGRRSDVFLACSLGAYS